VKVFSENALAEMLERDRATIKRAMRKVPPDATERKQPRWKLTTALEALDRLPGSHNAKNHRRNNDVGIVVHHNWLDANNWRDARIVAALVGFNEALTEMKTIEDIEQRRAFAIEKLAPLIAFHDKNFGAWETDNPAPGRFANDTDSVCARVCLLWSQQIEEAGEACGWTGDEGRKFLGDYGEDD